MFIVTSMMVGESMAATHDGSLFKADLVRIKSFRHVGCKRPLRSTKT